MKLRNIKICIMDSGRTNKDIAKDCDIHFTSFSQILGAKRPMPDRVKSRLETMFPELRDISNEK